MSKHIKCAVIGHPISHSKSPLIHNYWIKKYALNSVYTAIDTPPNDLKNTIRRLMDEGYCGFNITVPHKEAVFALCDELDAEASAIGAVNTVVVKDSKLLGMNTDAFGFIENIKQSAPGFDFTKGTAVILGAGGAARAIVYGLLRQATPKIMITNRTHAKSELIAKDFKSVIVANWDDRAHIFENANLVVNATSLGMVGNLPLDLDLSRLPKSAMVTDIVYKPLETNLLKQAQTQGNKTVTGIGMLLHQARPAFEAWFGIMPDVDDHLIKMVMK